MKQFFFFVLLSYVLIACQNASSPLQKNNIEPTFITQIAPVQVLPRQYLSNAKKDLTYIEVNQGLADNFINAILQDSQGYIWLGTHSKGALRYDGSSFKVFNTKDGLVDNNITTIFEDSKKRIWFGTYSKGISCFDGNRFKTYDDKHAGFKVNRVVAIAQDKENKMWFGNYLGLSSFDGKRFTTYTKKDGLISSSVLSLHLSKSGNLWIGTWGGLSCFDGKTFRNFTVKDGLIDNTIKSIAEDSNGNLWLGTQNGVSYFDGNHFKSFAVKDGLVHNDVWNVYADKDAGIWIGTLKGLSYFKNERLIKNITIADGLTTGHIIGLQGDNSGNIWMATQGGGLCRYRMNSFVTLELDKKLWQKGDFVYAIEEKRNKEKDVKEKDGQKKDHEEVLLGTLYKGVIQYKPPQAQKYEAISKLLGKSDVFSILNTQNNGIWFATNKGLIWEKKESIKRFTQKDGLASTVVLGVTENNRGGKWLSTVNGLSYFDGQSFKNFFKKDGLLSNFISTTHLDTQGKLWVATNLGLNYYDGVSFYDYRSKHPLLKNYIGSIFEDSQGDIWIGTKKGVVLYNGKKFKTLPKSDNRLSDEVNAFAEDKQGNIWLGVKNGICLLHPVEVGDYNKSLVFGKYLLFSFTLQDGFRGGWIPDNAMKLDSKNRLWIGSGEGATFLDLNTLKIPTNPPKVPHMTHIKVQNQYIDFRQLQQDTTYQAALGFGKDLQKSYREVAQWFNYPKQLILPHTLNHLTFHFSAIDWAAPHKLKFRYRLVGLENQWSVTGTENFADYRNIPYGKYTFEVQATGVAQKWSKTFAYSFEIRPPWWHTWWARTIYGLLGLALIIGYVQWRLAGYKKRQKLLEQALIGPLIQGYRLIELIGEGGFGRVYKAVQLRTEQLVAIKLLKDSKHSSQHQIDRFERETQLCAQISHPNIVKLLDKGHTEDGDLFAAFEYIEGETLKNRIIRKGVLSGVETGLLMAQVLDALSCAHEQGIVHRDLKPQNLMVGETSASMHIKVLDFGVGAFTEDFRTDDYKSLTITKETLGTPTYSAPEQLWGEPPTVKSDLYAWGLIVLECLTGTPVMGGNSLAEVFEKQINAEDVVIPDNILEHPLGDLLKRVLEKKTEKRVGSATRLYQECLEIDFNTLVVQAVAPVSYEAIDDTTMDNDLAVVLGKIHQQQITVFCLQLDLHIPEDSLLENEKLMSIQKDQLNRCISIVQSNGGYLANSFGNKLTFYFGYPKQNETHTQVAGQVALELMHHIQEQHKVLQKLYSFTLDTRMSIHTGEVLVKQNHEPEGLVLGVALNLLNQAKSNSILVSDASKQRIHSLANFEDSGSYTFSGIRNPIQVFSLVEGDK